jgi:hypothetical protein
MLNYLDNDGKNTPPGVEDPADETQNPDSGIKNISWIQKWEDEAARKHKERTEWLQADKEYQDHIKIKYGIKPKSI